MNCFIDQNIVNDILDFIYGFWGASRKRSDDAYDNSITFGRWRTDIVRFIIKFVIQF